MRQSDLRAPRAWVVAFCLGTFFFWASLYVYPPLLSLYAQHLGASLIWVGPILGSYGLAQLILRIPMGLWSDQLGRRKPFVLAGLALAAAGAGGLLLSRDEPAMFASRTVTGFAAAAWVVFSVQFSGYFTPRGVVRSMGIINFILGGSQVLATAAGGRLVDAAGWEAPFIASMALAAIGFVCMLVPGETSSPKKTSFSVKEFIAVGRAPTLMTVSIVAALFTWVNHSTAFGFTPNFAEVLGASKTEVGLLTTAMLVPMTLASLWTSGATERFGVSKVLVWSSILTAATMFAMPFVTSVAVLYVVQVLVGLGRGIAYPLLMALAIQKAPEGDRATAMGIFQAVYAIGMFAGPAVSGPLAQGLGLWSVFAASGVAAVVAGVLSFWKLTSGKEEQQG